MARVGLAGVAIAAIAWAALGNGDADPMPKAPHTGTKPDGRVYATIQVCWWPDHVGGVINTTIGPAKQADVQFNLHCQHPWSTRGLVSQGDKIALGWVMNPGQGDRTVDFRITINNREAKRSTRHVGIGLFECMAGIPPCVP